jgi:hypothetical protein
MKTGYERIQADEGSSFRLLHQKLKPRILLGTIIITPKLRLFVYMVVTVDATWAII